MTHSNISNTIKVPAGHCRYDVLPQQLISLGAPIGFNIDLNICQFIWQQKYVNLGSRIHCDEDDEFQVQNLGASNFIKESDKSPPCLHGVTP